MKGVLFYKLDNVVTNIGPKLRQLGQQVYKQGVAMQGNLHHDDKLVPSLRNLKSQSGAVPNNFDAEWVAQNAVVIGDVQLKPGSSVWHGATLRGDQTKITVGNNSLIQDNARLGSNSGNANGIVIGDNVFVGPNAVIEECELESFAYVGMGASIGKGSLVESFAVVAAGAHVPEGTTVPSGQIYAGSPARYLRDLTQTEKHLLGEHVLEQQQLATVYYENTEMTFKEQLAAEEEYLFHVLGDPQDKIMIKLLEYGMPQTSDDLEYIEHRVYHDYVGTVDY